jgi:Outer membrane cobalamin receptor protein
LHIFSINTGANVSLNSTQRIEGDKTDALNRQIEYNPLLNGTAFFASTHKKLTININGNYTHWQHTNQTEDDLLDEYLLVNTSINYDFMLTNKQKIGLIATVNNLTNKQYQSTLNYAMPGINYRLTIKYNFN